MKYFLILSLLFCILFTAAPKTIYAQDLSLRQRIEKVYENILENEIVVKIMTFVKNGWEKFKAWFNNLPGIKQYNESIYSGKNWKKTMNSMGKEYTPYLKQNSAGVKQIREGKKQWDNL
ncbi:MAG: hypothetical protein WC234_02260 [Endomicrobiaceae bacterium]